MAESQPSDIKTAAAIGVMERIKAMDFVQLLVVVLLSALLGSVIYGIPWAVREVKSFGMAQEESYRQERKETQIEHTKQINVITTTFERTLDRMEGRKPGIRKDENAAVHPERGDAGPPGTNE